MSNKERALRLIEDLPEYKMGFVVAYLQGLSADEAEDDAYCESLLEAYQNDPDPHKHDTVMVEQLAADLGVAL